MTLQHRAGKVFIMKVAVLMSTYNGEAYIEEQIRSILAQKCDAQVCLWVRDDGSTDGTQEILRQYAAEGKLSWYTGSNLRPAHSFMDLVTHCPGYDYYAFCDQDDMWYPEKLQEGIALLAGQDGPAMSFANARLVDGALNPIGRNVYNRQPPTDFYSVLCSGGILGCTVIYNRQLSELLQAFGQPEQLIMHDYYCAIICTLFDGVILFDPQPRMDYRQHGNNVVGTQWTKRAAIKDRLSRITKANPVSLARMAQSILDRDPQPADPEKLRFLKAVATYRDSVKNTLSLALSRKPRFNGRNMAVTVRLSILFRNT